MVLLGYIELMVCGEGNTQNDRGYYHRADSRLAPSQWETSLLSNAISHWVGANLESDLVSYVGWGWSHVFRNLPVFKIEMFLHWNITTFLHNNYNKYHEDFGMMLIISAKPGWLCSFWRYHGCRQPGSKYSAPASHSSLESYHAIWRPYWS